MAKKAAAVLEQFDADRSNTQDMRDLGYHFNTMMAIVQPHARAHADPIQYGFVPTTQERRLYAHS